MSYAVGIILAFLTAGFAGVVGLERERGFYPTVLVMIASYYILFAAMAATGSPIGAETRVFLAFGVVAAVGFRVNLWFVAAGLASHAILDAFHPGLIEDAGVPLWWPGFCLAYDLLLAGRLAWLLARNNLSARPVAALKPTSRFTSGAERLLGIVAVIVLGAASGGCASSARDAKTAQVGGHALSYRVIGSGRPALILISGLGDGMTSFKDVAPDLGLDMVEVLLPKAPATRVRRITNSKRCSRKQGSPVPM